MSLKLLKSTLTVGGMTLVSRITGLIRDIAFAQFLGSGLMADAFFVAFRIPNFFRRIFAEGAFSAGFVPVYAEYESRYSEHQVRAFLDLMAGRFGLILLGLTLLGVVGAPGLVSIIAPGFEDNSEKYHATVVALRFTFPYLMFVSLVAMAGAILNTRDRFAVPAVTPVLLNFCLIGAVFGLLPLMANGAVALSLGVLAAGFIQLGFQLPFLRIERRLPRPRVVAKGEEDRVGSAGVRRVFTLMLPAVFGVSVAQINLLVNTILASFLVTGSVSWLYYSDRLMEFPLGVFGIALATVILPALSTQVAGNSTGIYFRTIDWALGLVMIVTIPAMVALASLAYPLMVVLFHYGEFSSHDALMASYSLMAFSPGLLGFVMVKVLAPGFYAREDTRTPVRVGMVAMLVNALAAGVLTLVFQLGHVGLALATSISGLLNAVLLYHYLARDTGYRPGIGGNQGVGRSSWGVFVAKVVLASAIMGAVLLQVTGDPQGWVSSSVIERVIRLMMWIGLGSVVYFVCLYLLGIRLHDFSRPDGPHIDD